MSRERGQDSRLPIAGTSFSMRLGQKLESSLTAQFQLLGLELVSVGVDPVGEDELVETLTGAEISICIKARAICCCP